MWDLGDARERRVLRGHADAVSFAAWSPDDSTVVTCSGDNTARVWDARTGDSLFVLDKHKKSVRGARCGRGRGCTRVRVRMRRGARGLFGDGCGGRR